MMQKRLIIAALALLVWVALPLQLSYGYEAAAKINAGTYMESGSKPQLGILTGSNSVLVTQKESGIRAMLYTGVMHVNQSDEIQGVASFFILEKRIPWKSVQFYIDMGTGSLWRIREKTDDELTADILFETGIRVKDWFNVGVSYNYLPQDGPDGSFLSLSFNLIPSLQ